MMNRPEIVAEPVRTNRSVSIVGTVLDAVSIPGVLSIFETWVDDGRDHVVIVRDVHGIMRARAEENVRAAQDAADLVPPDGMPVVWLMRLTGFAEASRVCGIDLFPEACRYGLSRGWRHFLYGAAFGVAETLAKQMRTTFPGIQIVGTIYPPFRPLTADEDEVVCSQIRAARPHFLWVSLSTPKQDLWMTEHRGKCGDAIMVGIGGAFEINAGLIPRAPLWMRSCGLEWLYRLAKEPRRLWARYFQYLPVFLVLASLELFKRWINLDRGTTHGPV
jgi:N-acetylglucosaminyldiphosphoundecaprenol N-acetyl-beta-D-mannosaminyltransferase